MFDEVKQGSQGREREVPHSSIYIGNEVLRSEDFASLEKDRWINDKVVVLSQKNVIFHVTYLFVCLFLQQRNLNAYVYS